MSVSLLVDLVWLDEKIGKLPLGLLSDRKGRSKVVFVIGVSVCEGFCPHRLPTSIRLHSGERLTFFILGLIKD